jgi:DNA-binding transcriptional LysR family regulator
MSPQALPDLSTRQLRAVSAVAEYRSFIAAAAFLKMSQPALTRTIKQVESALGVPLFSRTTRHVAATAAGREFVALAERVLNDLKISVGSMRQHGEQQHGQVIVASVLSLAGAVLPSLIADYNRRSPGIEVHLREGIHNYVVDDVRAGVADFGIGYMEALPEAFVAEELATERFHVVFPSSSPLAALTEIEIGALKDTAFVSFPADSHTRRVVDGAAAAAGFALYYAMTANRLPTLLGLVRKRIGLAIVPASERPGIGDRGLTSRPLAGRRLSCRLGIMRLRDRELSPPAVSFLTVVKQWIPTLAPGQPRPVTRAPR